MIRLESHTDGTILPVRVHAGAKRDELRPAQEGILRVCVSQAPEKGKANKAIVGLLGKQLGLRKSQFELLSGATSRDKRFLVRGVTPAELAVKIEAVVETVEEP
ncbi:MAG TPA: DUF167 domain-containing protein [Thermoguttaceae bacterium]|nr:DUF167 domain-containing protein [Thermoguttaceae bacterium]